MTDYEVMICGLGPVGQLLALLLGDLGVRTLAVDRAAGPYVLPRAAVIDDEVLRILQSVGLDREVLAGAQVQPRVTIMTAGGRPVEVLRTDTGPLGHPPLVSINQPSIERSMLEALEDRETVETRWNTALDALDRRADRVDAYLRSAEGGPTERVSAKWLVGCDGGPSAVRSRLGIPFAGRTAAQRWVVVDGLVDRPLRRVPHPHFVGSRERPTVTLPMSPGRHRWEWMLRPGEDAAPFLQSAAIRRAIEPWLDGEELEVERAVVYTFHTRTAARWRRGRVLLAGDAAHLMPPFAGQGFSSGARDVANLSWKLAEVLGGASTTLLDTYEQERRPHVAAMQRLATTTGAFVQATHPAMIRARDVVLSTYDGTPLQRFLTTHTKPLPTYGTGAFATRPRRIPALRTTGSLFPQTARLDDDLGRGWAAVSIDATASAPLASAGLPVVDPGLDREWLERRGLAWAILRPDRFVFACGRPQDAPKGCRDWQRVVANPSGGPRSLGLVTA